MPEVEPVEAIRADRIKEANTASLRIVWSVTNQSKQLGETDRNWQWLKRLNAL